jgi:hypothetical protein
MIRAEAHTDDRVYEVDFDAADYFAQASDADILALHECGWGGDYPADYVAEFMATLDSDLEALFAYNARAWEGGFECHVRDDDAMAWLKIHRVALYESFVALDIEHC